MSPPDTQSPTASHLLSQSRGFLDAALKCVPYPFSEPAPPSAVAGVVCAAFALEMAFKALLTQSGADFPRDRTGHDLWKLFELLPQDIQRVVVRNSTKPEEMLREHLKRDTGTFVKWRYAPESAVKQAIVVDVDNLIEVTRAAIAVLEQSALVSQTQG